MAFGNGVQVAATPKEGAVKLPESIKAWHCAPQSDQHLERVVKDWPGLGPVASASPRLKARVDPSGCSLRTKRTIEPPP